MDVYPDQKIETKKVRRRGCRGGKRHRSPSADDKETGSDQLKPIDHLATDSVKRRRTNSHTANVISREQLDTLDNLVEEYEKGSLMNNAILYGEDMSTGIANINEAPYAVEREAKRLKSESAKPCRVVWVMKTIPSDESFEVEEVSDQNAAPPNTQC